MLISASYAEFMQDHEGEAFSDWLFAASESVWKRAVDHPFTSEIGNDSVSDEAFKRYLLEDYHYIQDLSAALGYLIAKAPSMEARSRLAQFLARLIASDNDYYERAFAALGVCPDDYDRTEPSTVTRAIGATLLSTAGKGHYVDGLAALLASEWINHVWTLRESEKPKPQRFYLAEWISFISAPEQAAFLDWLKREVDTLGAAERETRQQEILESFRYVCELEADFFDLVS